jgi:hypothetical protein
MSFGSTSGRGFESAASPYVWGAVLLIGLILWVVFHFDIKRMKRDEEAKTKDEEKDRDGGD